jgi:hypothetical protein
VKFENAVGRYVSQSACWTGRTRFLRTGTVMH